MYTKRKKNENDGVRWRETARFDIKPTSHRDVVGFESVSK